jgi:hypothetical protein
MRNIISTLREEQVCKNKVVLKTCRPQKEKMRNVTYHIRRNYMFSSDYPVLFGPENAGSYSGLIICLGREDKKCLQNFDEEAIWNMSTRKMKKQMGE